MCKKKVCLLSPGHLSSTPRLVKEAISLSQNNYDVTIVAGSYMSELASHDVRLASKHSWDFIPVNGGSWLTRKLFGSVEKLLRLLAGLKLPLPMYWLACADSRWSILLLNATREIKADLYIGHCFASLYPAARLANIHRVKAGFDAEDYHPGEFDPETLSGRIRISIRRKIEKQLFPSLNYRTTAAPLISKSYSQDYQLSFETILNVFSLTERPKTFPDSKSDGIIRFVWFSQVVGPGRGLEEILEILSKVKFNFEIHLAGFKSTEYETCLNNLAAKLAIQDKLTWHEHMAPDDLVAFCSKFDVGLCLEHNNSPHYALALTNKFFTYLLAGIPVILSQTPAQREIAIENSDCSLLVDLFSAEDSAKLLNSFCSNSDNLDIQKRSAWSLAEGKFNWEIEQEKFLALVKNSWDSK